MESAINLSDLISSRDSWEFAGYVALAGVAIGVAGEAIHDFTDWFKQRFSCWKTKGNKASVLFLVVALVSELVVQVKTNGINGAITASLSEEAAEIEHAAAWRRLSKEQKDKLFQSLRGQHFKYVFVTFTNDPESARFSDEINRVLEEAGLSINFFFNLGGVMNGTIATNLYGIFIGRGEEIEPLRSAFKNAGIEFSTEDPAGIRIGNQDNSLWILPKKPEY